MKKNIIVIVVLLFTFFINAKGQLKVNNNGRVEINGRTGSFGSYAPRVLINSSTTSLNGVNTGLSLFNTNTTNNNWVRLHFASKSTNGSEKDFVSIGAQFRSHSSGSERADFFVATRYNGSYSEKFRITGNGRVGIGTSYPAYPLDVLGFARVSRLIERYPSPYSKSVIEKLDLSKLLNLRFFASGDDGGSKTSSNVKYHLNQEDMEMYFPELIYDDDSDDKAVDYLSLIPFLVEAYKDQVNQVNELKTELELLKLSTNVDPVNNENDVAILYQNNPNPFKEITNIKFFIPTFVNKSNLCIYNLNGVQLKNFEIRAKGLVNYEINASELSPGIYLYDLILDGKNLGAKRMVITD